MSDETVFEEQKRSDEEPVSEAASVESNGEGMPAGDGETADQAPSLEQLLEEAQAEANDYKDRWLRSQAEFANARKRMDKERVLTYQNATADLAGKLLPVLDDFERAMENAPSEVSAISWFEGVELVHRKLLSILEGLGVQPISAVGQPFDPNLHEAITQEPTDEYESGTVMRELQKGYQLGDRVIRPSLVCVAQ